MILHAQYELFTSFHPRLSSDLDKVTHEMLKLRLVNTNSINYQNFRLLKSFKSRNKLPLKKRFHYYSVLYKRSEFLYLRIGSTEN